MATVPTTTGTYLTNLFNPQVVADLIDTKLTNKIVFAPLARIDNTLVGRAGNTVTLPYYSYIGAAAQVNEGTDIPIRQLTQTTTPVTIVKYGVGAQLTDEAVLSGYGDPVEEATNQIVTAIADAVDNQLLTALNGNTTNVYTTASASTPLAPDDIPAALAKFGEDNDGVKVLLVDPDFYVKLLRDNWIPASEIAADVKVRGAVGMSYGCQVIVTNRLKNTNTLHIVKPGALAIFMKRDTLVETDRDIVNQSTVITGSKLFAPYLLNAGAAIKLTLGA
jgi:N4-gp56 family major capsid protein